MNEHGKDRLGPGRAAFRRRADKNITFARRPSGPAVGISGIATIGSGCRSEDGGVCRHIGIGSYFANC